MASPDSHITKCPPNKSVSILGFNIIMLPDPTGKGVSYSRI